MYYSTQYYTASWVGQSSGVRVSESYYYNEIVHVVQQNSKKRKIKNKNNQPKQLLTTVLQYYTVSVLYHLVGRLGFKSKGQCQLQYCYTNVRHLMCILLSPSWRTFVLADCNRSETVVDAPCSTSCALIRLSCGLIQSSRVKRRDTSCLNKIVRHLTQRARVTGHGGTQGTEGTKISLHCCEKVGTFNFFLCL